MVGMAQCEEEEEAEKAVRVGVGAEWVVGGREKAVFREGMGGEVAEAE